MATSTTHELFQRWRAGDKDALRELLPHVYEELRRLARRHLRGERSNHTLQTTALVHEAYLRLMAHEPRQMHDRTHFVALASHLMRQALIDHARERLAKKRHGGDRITLTDDVGVTGPREVDLLAVDAALTRLSELDAQQGRVVELRFFGGLSIRETSEALGVSEATIKRDWATARAWLLREMQGAGTVPSSEG